MGTEDIATSEIIKELGSDFLRFNDYSGSQLVDAWLMGYSFARQRALAAVEDLDIS